MKKVTIKRAVKYLLAILVVAIGVASYYLYKVAPMANGYSAKYICSHVFVSGQDAKDAMELYTKPIHKLFDFVSYDVDYEKKKVTSKLFGFLGPATAVYNFDCGCTLLPDGEGEPNIAVGSETKLLHTTKDTTFPYGNKMDVGSIPANVNIDKINTVLAKEFVETTNDLKERKNTFAIVVAYKDRIIAEQYKKGISDTTPLLSWSASKSIISTLIGTLVKTKGLNIYKPAPIKEWKADDRKSITVDQLLRMESGLAFDEKYAPMSDAVQMLFEEQSMAKFAVDKKLQAAPGLKWSYSSGTTNILSKIVFDMSGGSMKAAKQYAHEALFDKIGMTSPVFEVDASGVFVGSSYFHASAKDWVRVGILYKNNGVWNREQVLPKSWVDYALTATPHAPDGRYGAQIWLNNKNSKSKERLLPRLPKDTYAFQGYQGQWIVVIPSKDLVVARFGATNGKTWSIENLILAIMSSIE